MATKKSTKAAASTAVTQTEPADTAAAKKGPAKGAARKAAPKKASKVVKSRKAGGGAKATKASKSTRQPKKVATSTVAPAKAAKKSKVIRKKAGKTATRKVVAAPAARVQPTVNTDLDRAQKLIADHESTLERLRRDAERLEEGDTKRRLALVRAELPLIAEKISDSDRNSLIALLQKTGARRGRKAGKVAKKRPGKKRTKFKLPTGEAWSGMGPRPKAFKAWQAANPGKPFPTA